MVLGKTLKSPLDCKEIQPVHLKETSPVRSQVQSLSQEDLLEKEMATHSSILAWEIPWIEEPGRVQLMGSHKSRT